MASSTKKKTTMAKLQRESRLRERRQVKAAKKDARKREAAAEAGDTGESVVGDSIVNSDGIVIRQAVADTDA